MKTEASGAGAGRQAPKAKVSPARNGIAVILLLAFASMAFLEFRANSGYSSAVSKLEAKVPKDAMASDEKGITQPEVEALIGKRDGVVKKSETETTVKYVWKGVFRQYAIVAHFTDDATPKLSSIETSTGS